jgi:hypothetical protein
MVLERTKIWSWVPTGSETKNDSAGEGQQQFAGLDWAPGAPSPEAKQQGREAVHSPPSNAEVRNGGVMPQLPHVSIA